MKLHARSVIAAWFVAVLCALVGVSISNGRDVLPFPPRPSQTVPGKS